MTTNIFINLSPKEIKTFVDEFLSLKFLREFTKNNKLLRDNLHGFRPETADHKKLGDNLLKFLSNGKSAAISAQLSGMYFEIIKQFNQDVESLKQEKIPSNLALALTIKKKVKPSCRDLFYKLQGYNDETKKEVDSFIKAIEVSTYLDEELKREYEKEIKELNNSDNALAEKLGVVDDRISGLDKKIEGIKTEMDSLKQINYDEGNKSLMSHIDLKVAKAQENILNKVSTKLDGLSSTEDIAKLKKEVNSLKEKLTSKSFHNDRFSVFHSSVSNYNYDKYTYDESEPNYLDEYIGDAISNQIEDKQFIPFREYLKEIIFSKKPLIVPSRCSSEFAYLLASCMTGGNYETFSLESNYDEEELFNLIEQAPNFSGNKVILIKNKINVSDYRNLLNFIKERPFTEKYIFEIGYDKEVMFMPPEVIDEFNFFFGKLKNQYIEYKFSYDYVNEKRKPLTNGTFTHYIKAIGSQISDFNLMNVKYGGLLAYSIIPFISLHDDVETEELINKILDDKIRKECEAVLDE